MIFPPTILSDYGTINCLLSDRRPSFARFGDGEYRLVTGHGTKTQPRDPKLAKRMRSILQEPHEDVLVGILDLYSGKEVATPWPSREATTARYGSEKWARKYLDPEAVYGCAGVTRLCNWALGDREAWRELVEQLWAGRDVLVVTGSSKGLKAEQMVEPLARSGATLFVRQAVGAWEQYPFIFDFCLHWGREYPRGVVLAALGATATVLAHDLGREGIQCIDIGHMPQSLAGIEPKTINEP